MTESAPDYDEKWLLAGLAKGNEKSFEFIYRHYSPRIFSNLNRLVKMETVAQEILQDVFISVWNNRQHIDLDKSFSSYLFKIAENKAFDFFRKAAADRKRRAQLIAMASTWNNPADESIDSNEAYWSIIDKAIAALPEQRQRVYRLCKLEGKSYKEVQEILGLSASTISDHIVKGNKAIRDYIEHNDHVLLALFFLSLCISA
jgi:RNA polymerase sigma-70 factor (family 1)